jgi:hypothetical protein
MVPSEQTPNLEPKANRMSLAAIFPVVVLETILKRLAALFIIGAGGDPAAAQQAAAQMLASYNPQTEEELCIAANIVGFSFQALEALGQAADPDMSLTRVLRLRSGAVSLSREADRARRSLAQLQKIRQQTQPAEQPQTPQAASPPAPVPQYTAPTRPQTEEERQRDIRIAAGLKRLEARTAATAAAQADGTHTNANSVSSAAIPATAASNRAEASPASML